METLPPPGSTIHVYSLTGHTNQRDGKIPVYEFVRDNGREYRFALRNAKLAEDEFTYYSYMLERRFLDAMWNDVVNPRIGDDPFKDFNLKNFHGNHSSQIQEIENSETNNRHLDKQPSITRCRFGFWLRMRYKTKIEEETQEISIQEDKTVNVTPKKMQVQVYYTDKFLVNHKWYNNGRRLLTKGEKKQQTYVSCFIFDVSEKQPKKELVEFTGDEGEKIVRIALKGEKTKNFPTLNMVIYKQSQSYAKIEQKLGLNPSLHWNILLHAKHCTAYTVTSGEVNTHENQKFKVKQLIVTCYYYIDDEDAGYKNQFAAKQSLFK